MIHDDDGMYSEKFRRMLYDVRIKRYLRSGRGRENIQIDWRFVQLWCSYIYRQGACMYSFFFILMYVMLMFGAAYIHSDYNIANSY